MCLNLYVTVNINSRSIVATKLFNSIVKELIQIFAPSQVYK